MVLLHVVKLKNFGYLFVVVAAQLTFVISGADARTEIELRRLVRHDCGSCHGLTLRGGLGPELSQERIRKLSDTYLFEVIKNGKAGTAMPPWKAILTDPEIKTIIVYLKDGDLK
ncbi:MAG: cytochrome c [Calothrix sp. SM1_5_4]|nr:cytochrome c [Calothrix sp. SM1_5_4]